MKEKGSGMEDSVQGRFHEGMISERQALLDISNQWDKIPQGGVVNSTLCMYMCNNSISQCAL